MTILVWLSIGVLVVLMGLFLYWSLRDDRAKIRWMRNVFIGGITFFFVLFVVFTLDTMQTIRVKTHEEALTAEVVNGKLVWQKYVCIDCHTIQGLGAYYGPDLTRSWNRFMNRAGSNEQAAQGAMVAFIRNPPQATVDRRGMPFVNMSEEEAAHLVAFLRWHAMMDLNGWPPEPSRPILRAAGGTQPLLAFSAHAQEGKDLFAKRDCIACHSVGRGVIVGPDLQGAASKYDHATLVRWIADPEAIYAERGRKPINPEFPEMPTVDISHAEAEAIAAYLFAAGGKEY